MMIGKDDTVISRRVGKVMLKMRKSHMLPVYYENDCFYDKSLPEICRSLKAIDGYLSIIDVGANIGDTVALIAEKVNGSFLCIEGDKEYIPLLKENTSSLKECIVSIEESFCSDHDEKSDIYSILRYDGTSKIIKKKDNKKSDKIIFKTLSSIVNEHPEFYNTNLIKIDTDGFELSVLKGAADLIKKTKPILFFEFTPADYIEKGQDPLEIFILLRKYGYKEGLFYDNYGKVKQIVSFYDIDKINNLIASIDNKTVYYFDVLTHYDNNKYHSLISNALIANIRQYDEQYRLINIKLNEKNNKISALREIENKLSFAQSKIENYQGEIYDLKNQIEVLLKTKDDNHLKKEYKAILKQKNDFEDQLRKIYNSQGYRLLRRFYLIKHGLSSLNDKIKNNLVKTVSFRQKRRINRKSNKIVYIGHSYHEKTNSTKFLINFLKKYFELKVVLDESWIGKPYPDLSFINDDYIGVIFFQQIPEIENLNKIKNDNIIIIPMFDGHGYSDFSFWKNYAHVKFINFSKTLHEKLINWGFESIYVKYFPEVRKFIPGNNKKLFFWQRNSTINVNILAKLVGDAVKFIHIHKALDPGQEFIKPSKQITNKYDIKYSTWLKKKSVLEKILEDKALYLAPREFEGIGLSFLEAMAMGKAVIAADNPTMNEYITDNYNGYLFNIHKPSQINFSRLKEIQINAYNYMRDGYAKWEKDKNEIIDFIRKQ